MVQDRPIVTMDRYEEVIDSRSTCDRVPIILSDPERRKRATPIFPAHLHTYDRSYRLKNSDHICRDNTCFQGLATPLHRHRRLWASWGTCPQISDSGSRGHKKLRRKHSNVIPCPHLLVYVWVTSDLDKRDTRNPIFLPISISTLMPFALKRPNSVQ